MRVRRMCTLMCVCALTMGKNAGEKINFVLYLFYFVYLKQALCQYLLCGGTTAVDQTPFVGQKE